jgi:biotin-dependent carboxylase-like uncharacterized protein
VSEQPALRVTSVGSATVQDLGRTGWAHLGVPASGALDRAALLAANRALGNPDGAAAIEVVSGGLMVEALGDVHICLTGAQCSGVAHGEPFLLRAGDVLRLTPPYGGMRTYLAVAGGIDVPLVLGSASWDSLSHLGTPPLAIGDELPIGSPVGHVATSTGDGALVRPFDGSVRLWPGPRADLFVAPLAHLTQHVWSVSVESNRVGLRLGGAPLVRVPSEELPSEELPSEELPSEELPSEELPSEGLVTGAVQIPHDGLPIVMLADHPTTGGYPVVAVVDPADLDHLAQVRPGDLLRFRQAQARGRG